MWRAYTEKELLDQWWGPAPWRTETKTMNFSVGGYWLYAMVSPENHKHWGRMNYLAISHHKSFEIEDSFCDEEGNINHNYPVSTGKNIFSRTENGTLVEFILVYATEADLEKIVEMGFEQGISIGLDQLEKLLTQINH